MCDTDLCKTRSVMTNCHLCVDVDCTYLNVPSLLSIPAITHPILPPMWHQLCGVSNTNLCFPLPGVHGFNAGTRALMHSLFVGFLFQLLVCWTKWK